MQGTQERAFKIALSQQLPIAFATDAGVFPHGDNAREFKLRVGMGQAPMAAIEGATRIAAEAIGWSDRVGHAAARALRGSHRGGTRSARGHLGIGARAVRDEGWRRLQAATRRPRSHEDTKKARRLLEAASIRGPSCSSSCSSCLRGLRLLRPQRDQRIHRRRPAGRGEAGERGRRQERDGHRRHDERDPAAWSGRGTSTARGRRGGRDAIPSTRPIATSVSPCRSTIAITAPRLAPSAIRTPNSRVRCVTEVAITPPMPASVTSSARPAKTLSSVAVRRGAARASERRSSSVCMFSTGWFGSTRVHGCAQRLREARGLRRRADQHLAREVERGLGQRHVDLRHRLLGEAELTHVGRRRPRR